MKIAGVFRVTFDYDASQIDELTADENTLLVQIHKEGFDDDNENDGWMCARTLASLLGDDVEASDAIEGFFPLNYCTLATPDARCTAAYAYEAANDDELSVRFSEPLDVYYASNKRGCSDDGAASWTLCKRVDEAEYGLVPANYLQPIHTASDAAFSVAEFALECREDPFLKHIVSQQPVVLSVDELMRLRSAFGAMLVEGRKHTAVTVAVDAEARLYLVLDASKIVYVTLDAAADALEVQFTPPKSVQLRHRNGSFDLLMDRGSDGAKLQSMFSESFSDSSEKEPSVVAWTDESTAEIASEEADCNFHAVEEAAVEDLCGDAQQPIRESTNELAIEDSSTTSGVEWACDDFDGGIDEETSHSFEPVTLGENAVEWSDSPTQEHESEDEIVAGPDSFPEEKPEEELQTVEWSDDEDEIVALDEASIEIDADHDAETKEPFEKATQLTKKPAINSMISSEELQKKLQHRLQLQEGEPSMPKVASKSFNPAAIQHSSATVSASSIDFGRSAIKSSVNVLDSGQRNNTAQPQSKFIDEKSNESKTSSVKEAPVKSKTATFVPRPADQRLLPSPLSNQDKVSSDRNFKKSVAPKSVLNSVAETKITQKTPLHRERMSVKPEARPVENKQRPLPEINKPLNSEVSSNVFPKTTISKNITPEKGYSKTYSTAKSSLTHVPTHQSHVESARPSLQEKTKSTINLPLLPESKSGAFSPKNAVHKPQTCSIRQWSDRTGAFKTDAVFICYAQGNVTLRKANGVNICVPLESLSTGDIDYLKSVESALQNYFPTSYNNFDWLKFLTAAQIPASLAVGYAQHFVREKMDASSIEYIDRSVLKSFGFPEGDIIKIKRMCDTYTEHLRHTKMKESQFGEQNLHKISQSNTHYPSQNSHMTPLNALNQRYPPMQPMSASSGANGRYSDKYDVLRSLDPMHQRK